MSIRRKSSKINCGAPSRSAKAARCSTPLEGTHAGCRRGSSVSKVFLSRTYRTMRAVRLLTIPDWGFERFHLGDKGLSPEAIASEWMHEIKRRSENSQSSTPRYERAPWKTGSISSATCRAPTPKRISASIVRASEWMHEIKRRSENSQSSTPRYERAPWKTGSISSATCRVRPFQIGVLNASTWAIRGFRLRP